jgi:YHS domain-containing protein
MAFIFADLVILPLIVIYRKYYGRRFALRITVLMLVTMVVAALIIDLLFAAVGAIPGGARPSRSAVFGSLAVDYKLVLNLVGLAIFVSLFWLTVRRGTKDPVCRMTVQASGSPVAVLDGRRFHFCSEGCRAAFEADPGRYVTGRRGAGSRLSARR